MSSHLVSRRALVAASFLVIGGCSSAPGTWLDKDRLSDNLSTPTDTTIYPVKLITASVVTSQQEARAALRVVQERKALPAYLVSPARSTPYRIASPDILSITVYGHPEMGSPNAPMLSAPDTTGTALSATGRSDPGAPLSQGARVSADGKIFFPTLGRVQVSGKTTEEVAANLTQLLASRIHQPEVDVSVSRYMSQQVDLTGELKTPGTFPITDSPMTLVNAIARAGGVMPNADLRRVRLTRDGRSTILNADMILDQGDVRNNIMLRGGDILNVPDRGENRVFVIGEAMKPSAIPMSTWRLTLADALASAGSIDPKAADPRQVYVIRGAQEEPTAPLIYRLDMTQIDAILLETQFELEPLDVIYIGTASSVRFNRILDQVLPSLQALFYTVQLTR